MALDNNVYDNGHSDDGDLECHFCCFGDNCNRGLVPERDSLYTPPGQCLVVGVVVVVVVVFFLLLFFFSFFFFFFVFFFVFFFFLFSSSSSSSSSS